MLIKLVGSVMVLGAGAGWGLMKSGELAKREKSLRNLKTALGVLESEIVFSSHYLKHALGRISEICGCGTIFSDISEQIGEIAVSKAWHNALLKNKKRLGLKDADIEILAILGSELGRSDREQQVRNIRHVTALLDQALEEAHNEYLQSAKLYRSMGILGGLFVVVLLL